MKKRILVIIERQQVSQTVTVQLITRLGDLGFDITLLQVFCALKPVEIIQLDKLSSGQYRRLIDKINKIKEEQEKQDVTV